MKKISIISLIVVLIDQILKLFALNLSSAIKIIPKFLYLVLAKNKGGAWSIFDGQIVFLIIISIISLFLIYKYLIKNQNLKKLEIYCYGLLIGGIVGNLIDRIVRGYVIDYIGILIGSYKFPIFNLADIFIVVPIIILVIDSFWSDRSAKN